MPNPYVIPATVRCAGPNCEHVKGENNHWFTVIPVIPAESYSNSAICEILKGVLTTCNHSLPVCGEACLLKVISGLLQKEKP